MNDDWLVASDSNDDTSPVTELTAVYSVQEIKFVLVVTVCSLSFAIQTMLRRFHCDVSAVVISLFSPASSPERQKRCAACKLFGCAI